MKKSLDEKKVHEKFLQKFWSNPEDYFPQILNFTKIWFTFFLFLAKSTFTPFKGTEVSR